MENKDILNTYNEKSIQHLEFLDHIRKRPSGYIPNKGIQGQNALIREVIDNSLDELEECVRLDYNQDLILSFNIYYSKSLEKYLVSVHDTGRGIPFNKIEELFTLQHTSGKFDSKSYKSSSGLYGIGVKVTVALSDIFKVFSFRNNNSIIFTINEVNNIRKIYEDKTYKNPLVYSETLIQFIISNKYLNEIKDYIKYKKYLFFKELFMRLSLFKPKYIIKFNVMEISKKEFLKIEKLLYNTNTSGDELFNIHNLYYNKKYKPKYSFEYNYNYISNKSYYEYITDIINSKFNLNINQYKLLKLKELLEINNNQPIERLITSNIKILSIENLSIIKHKYPIRIGLVNNIILENYSDYHFSILNELLKEYLIKFIDDINIREFFITTDYKFPFLIIINIQYSEAEFVGTTKHAFRDISFKSIYKKWLTEYFNNNIDKLKNIYLFIKDHITTQYNKFNYKSTSIQDNKKLLLSLNRPEKFSDCISNDSSKTELFLVEGESAKSVVGRDSKIQAIYTLGGKPCNAILEIGKENKSIQKLIKNPIFGDIIKLLNIEPNTPNLSKLKFNKIFITSDADTHGYHIASIIASNLFLYNKYLILDGHVNIVIPPLYGLKFKTNSKLKNTPTLYIRSKNELIYTLCEYIYKEVFDIIIEKNNQSYLLPFESYVVFIQYIFDIMEQLNNVSNILNIPPIIIETLLLIKDILIKNTITNQDLEYINKTLNMNIIYDKTTHSLIIEHDLNDYIIPIFNFNYIYQKYLHDYLLLIDWFNIDLYIKLKSNNKMIPMCVTKLYELCNSFNNLYDIERYKGIGSMDPIDRKISCLDPNTRITFTISDIGDVDIIYGMMGNNSTYRKQKLVENFLND